MPADDIGRPQPTEPEHFQRQSDPLLAGSENLVSRAVCALATYSGHDPALQIDLHKRIPVGGGLGGGSSDAAVTLRSCNELWDLGLDSASLAGIGAGIGSDVPLFLNLPSAVIMGRGERVEPVALRWAGWVLLVFVGPGVSTGDVYRQWSRADSASMAGGADEAILRAVRAEDISLMITNHLQPAVFRASPAIARIHKQLHHLGVGPMHVSGAGSTMYRLFDNKDEACSAAKSIEERGLGVATSVVAAPVGQDPIMMSEEE